MAGLNLQNLRQAAPPQEPLPDALDVDLSDIAIDPAQAQEIELPDGSVSISIGPPIKDKKTNKFNDNLAEYLDETVLGGLADDLLRGIEEDSESRKEWLDNRAEGIKLLGLTINPIRSGANDGAAPVEGMSQVRHPLLLEAVVRFQATAGAELLPADGPVKVRNDDPNATTQEDALADALEKDMNHYLTVTDKDYVPDTDQLLFRIALDGCGFKKIYHDPIKQRPVSLSVSAEDVIVSNAAVSLRSAARVTHRIFMRPSIMKRMQILGAYRDVDLQEPDTAEKSAVDQETETATGLQKNESFEPKNRDFEVYETYCELDIPGFEHKHKGKTTGLAVPYKVVLEKHSRVILEIRRNWDQDDKLCLPKTFFVQYPFIPGMGFYCIGLGQMLGNMANGLTAAWREFIDAGMFACFPGFLYAKSAGRQNSNEFRVPPGGGAPIETGGLPINQAVMPLPYKEPGPVFTGFIQGMEQTGARLGGTGDINVAEGRQDAAVGTTMALLEQANKPMDAVHKRLCRAQAEELALLVDRFREDPEAFWRSNKAPTLQWDEEQFIQAIENYDLVPQADPNTSSHVQRIGKNQALYMMAKDDPGSFDLKAVRTVCLRGIGFGQPDQFFQQSAPQSDPKAMAEAAKAQALQMTAQAELQDSQTKALDVQFRQKNAAVEDQNRDKDRQSAERVAAMKLRTEQVIHNSRMRHEDAQQARGLVSDHLQQAGDHAHDLRMAGVGDEQPPIPGARKAPDGNFYVQHPVTGQHYRVDQVHAGQ